MKKQKSALFGIMITAGTAIGAGMFSLPIISSGMWLFYSFVCLLSIWFLNYLSALYVLESNLKFSPGASFDTITSQILGKKWNILVSIFIGFLMYILLYAYFSAFGDMAIQNINLEILKNNHWTQGITSFSFGLILAFSIWLSTGAVGRISSILVFAMIASFITLISGSLFSIDMDKLLDRNGQNISYLPYLWVALPYYTTSFGFVTVVPSLYKFYESNLSLIKKSLLIGSLIVLFVYTLFIIVSFGNISRDEFALINQNGGNIGSLVKSFEEGSENQMINFVLNLFSNFAIITSFLGIGLSLFDFIADKFSLPNNKIGRLKTACITFLPPAIANLFFPNGFLIAIGFAGLFSVLGFFVAPFFMILKVRKSETNTSKYRVFGGTPILVLFFLASLLIIVCLILSMLEFLPHL